MGYWKINDLRASTFLFSVICDRTVEKAFDPVFVAIAQHRIRPRQPLLRGISDKRLPAKAFFEGGHGACLAVNAGAMGAEFRKHPLFTCRRASAPTHLVRLPLELRVPGHV